MDVHTGPSAKEAWDFLFAVLDALEELEATAIVEGGWAVAAYGSPVASVDIDVAVDDRQIEPDTQRGRDLHDLLELQGKYRDLKGNNLLDWCTLDELNKVWATEVGYRRRTLYDGRLQRATLTSPAGESRALDVPTADALAMMKLKAFRDRQLQYRVMGDPTLRASYDNADLMNVPQDTDHLLRKAAKDLVDVGLLARWSQGAALAGAYRLLAVHGMERFIREAVTSPNADVVAAADYLLERHAIAWRAQDVLNALREAG